MLFNKFPSPLGVIFSLINHRPFGHSYTLDGVFPSPLGVIFSLIGTIITAIVFPTAMFPSPLGVIFSLI